MNHANLQQDSYVRSLLALRGAESDKFLLDALQQYVDKQRKEYAAMERKLGIING